MSACLALALCATPACTTIVDVDDYTFDTDPCGAQRARTCEGGRELAFVVRTSGIPAADSDGQRDGFDLDGTDAPICGQRDFTSESATAVDNQMAEILELYEDLASVDLREDYERDTLTGTSISILVLSHVDDLANDDCIEITQRPGVLPEGVDIATLDADGDGLLDEGLTLDYLGPLDNDPSACAIDGTIHARFSSRLQSFAGGVEVTTDRSRLRMLATEEGAFGLLGGSLRVDELRGLPDAVLQFFRPRADLDPSSRAADDCASLSFALTFQAIPVTLGTRRSP